MEKEPKKAKAETAAKAIEKPEPQNIYEAILEVYNQIGYVQKGGYNDNQKYKFAGEADFIKALRPAMAAAKIIIHPSKVRKVEFHEIRKGDKVTLNIAAIFGYDFIHAPSKTKIYAEVIGEGSDSLDKSSYKAMTGAFKYALRQTFMIETGNDPDEHGAKEEKKEEEKPKVPSLAAVDKICKDWFAKLVAAKLKPEKAAEKFQAFKVAVSGNGINYWDLANHTYPEIGEDLIKSLDTYCKQFNTTTEGQ